MAHAFLPYLVIAFLLAIVSNGQLDHKYYDDSCPNMPIIVRNNVWTAYRNDTRIAASLLRLHFHDCFVNGCDGSVLLDGTAHFKGEKNAGPNRNSIRGLDIIDKIKNDLERDCPSTVSCADILTLAAREAVISAGGPYWEVSLGRRDGLTSLVKAANANLPSPFEPLDKIIAKFTSNGLDIKDVVVLSGAHTIGFAQCFTFKRRLFNFKSSGKPDPTLDPSLLTDLQENCPNVDGSNSKLNPLDTYTTEMFDNTYYQNLVNNYGLLESDQALMANEETAEMVNEYSMYPYLFARDFAASMVKLGNIGVITGEGGQIRKKCASVN
ncbi:hypothetical protein ACET3Z_030525 [Daucus carota]